MDCRTTGARRILVWMIDSVIATVNKYCGDAEDRNGHNGPNGAVDLAISITANIHAVLYMTESWQ